MTNNTEQEPTVFDGVCGGCANKAADGWALYCVECWEKAEQRSDSERMEPVKRFTSDDVKVAFENGYAAAMSVADIAKEAEQEPVAWMNDSAPIGVFARHKEGAENFGCTVPLYAAPARTKDLTDDDLLGIWFGTDGLIEGLRAVIAADREKNK